MLNTAVSFLNIAAGRALGALLEAAAARPAALATFLAVLAALAAAIWVDLLAGRDAPAPREKPIRMRNR